MTKLTPQQKEKTREALAAMDIVKQGDFAIAKKILEFMDFIEEYTSKFEEFSSEVDETVGKYQKTINEGLSSHMEEIAETMKAFKDTWDGKVAELYKKSDKAQILKDLDTLRTQFSSFLPKVEGAVKELKQEIIKQKESIIASFPEKFNPSEILRELERMEKKINDLPQTLDGEEIKNKLTSLPEGSKLGISAIENLREELDELRRLIKSMGTGRGGVMGGGSSSGGNVVRYYDLSASLDGVTTTFALPAFNRIISITLSSVPTILRPTVDYTVDASAMTVTFTSQIDVSTSLASGQTCIIIYAET